MNEMSWQQIDFTHGFNIEDIYESSNDTSIKEAFLTILMAIMILTGAAIVSYTGITIYKTYTSHKEVEGAMQLARDQNRQIDIYTSSNFSMTVNVNHNSSLSIAGNNASVTRITVYPRNYLREKIVRPNGTVIMPYSLSNEI